MKNFKKYLIIAIIILAGLFIFWLSRKNNSNELNSADKSQKNTTPAENNNINSSSKEQAQDNKAQKAPDITFIGPRQNIDKNTPNEEGFWSFAISTPGMLSRSGQPSIKDFQWLHDNGWKSVVDLRIDNDHGEQADDMSIPGFKDLNFNYLRIQMVDGAAPTDEQAKEFLDFVTKPENQPAHVHCRGGYGRAGIMTALYRYSVEGWPADKAIEESRLFHGGVDEAQQKWLENWAKNNQPKNYGIN